MGLHFKNKETREIKGEVFKPYPLNTQYLASNFGRIKSKQQIVKHNSGSKAIKKERILTQTDNGSGYLSVGLTENGKTKTIRVSRIIAITFIENKENKPQVNHKNGIKYDNRVENLEWNTCGENVRHAWNNGLAKKQESFLYVQKRLFQINNYITFKPRVKTPIGFGTIIIDQNCYRIQYDNGKFENLVKSIRFWGDDFKLVLLDLSDLTKEIEVNGEVVVVADIIFPEEDYTNKFDRNVAIGALQLQNAIGHTCTFYQVVETLFKYHFDVFNLIDKGLAIDIKSLNP